MKIACKKKWDIAQVVEIGDLQRRQGEIMLPVEGMAYGDTSAPRPMRGEESRGGVLNNDTIHWSCS